LVKQARGCLARAHAIHHGEQEGLETTFDYLKNFFNVSTIPIYHKSNIIARENKVIRNTQDFMSPKEKIIKDSLKKELEISETL